VPGSLDPASVVVVDPRPIVREGLPLLLRDHGVQVVAGAASGSVAAAVASQLDPDVVLAAERLADGDATALTARLLRQGARAAVVFLVDGDEGHYVQRAVRAGAAGVVGTGRPASQVARALLAVAGGHTWFTESDWVDVPTTAELSRHPERLSGAEKRVLALVAAGASTEGVAAALGVSPHTVRTHVRNLMRKLNAQSRAHAVAIAIRAGAVDV
jgi:DNA-binding NarL/FixJ family response regulator